MADYTAPVNDIEFTLHHIAGLPALLELDSFSHADPDMVRGLLDEAGRFMSEVVAPLNVTSDRVGSTLDPEAGVVTPDGFREAYARYVDAGWGGVQFPAEYGGGSLPWAVGAAVQEMITSASMAFSLCPLLTQGAIEALLAHGTEEQKELFLEKMITGAWPGTMNLTEPQAGSDVGALRTKAVPNDDGTWSVTGTKIFITWGDHDMAENIVHLVLARTPGAPPGTKGISLFLVPKFLIEPDGSSGERNDVTVVSIEHKLGIHGSPTCVLAFGENGGAIGHLIGEENQGMRYMFTMMNNARLGVGIEGLAITERAYQQALAFAQERRQGRAVGAPPGEASPIVDHPDVRRMLLTMKASIEAMRALLLTNAAGLDLAVHGPDEAVRRAADERVALLTPISKGWCTDLGVELTSTALQVHGGMGYVEETGVAQHFRDARIAPIYEGTNGIQAIDLVGRKLPMREGGVMADFVAEMRALDSELATAGEDLASIRTNLAEAVDVLEQASAWLLDHSRKDRNDVLAGATPFLRLFATTTGGYLMARQAVAAHGLLADGDDGSVAAKITTARFFAEQILPQVHGLLPAVTAGAEDLFAIETKRLGV